MLEIQKLLRSTFDGAEGMRHITEDLAIKVFEHPELPLVGFSYCQIDSPKYHPIVREARGLVLEKGTWKVVSRGFNRFYNLGEDQDDGASSQKNFDWNNFVANTKEDGSYIGLWFYSGKWHINTRGSFAKGEMGFSGKSWEQVFWETWKAECVSPLQEDYDPIENLNPDNVYIFEFWTPYNEVVRTYDKPSLFLLTVVSLLGSDNLTYELPEETVDCAVLKHKLDRSPALRARIEQTKAEVEAAWLEVLATWRMLQAPEFENQKNFAIKLMKGGTPPPSMPGACVPLTPFHGLLFANRKNKGDEKTLRELWLEASDLIVKVLYPKQAQQVAASPGDS